MPEPIDDATQITLWGLPRSGKTFLLRAFEHQVKQIAAYLRRNGEFDLSLYQSKSSTSTRGRVDPTDTLTPETWIFTRKSEKKDCAHQVSTHYHTIRVIDNSGSVLHTPSQQEIANDPAIVTKAAGALNLLKNSDRLVLTLELGNINSGPDLDAEGGVSSRFSSQDFFVFLRELWESLMQNGSPSRPVQIAGCLTKSDELGRNVETLDELTLLILRFGEEYGRRIYDLTHHQSPSWFSYKFFACSAAGRLSNNQVNISGNSVADFNEWHPINVEAPFFWLFEETERNRLDQSITNMSSILRFFYGRTARQARGESYISYSEMLREYYRT